MSATDRILGSFKALVQGFTARLPLAFVWRYSVSACSETYFSGRKLSPLCPFDDMPKIPLMPGIAGAGIKPAIGSIVGIAFLDGDPSKPTVVCWDQTVPQSVMLDATDRIQVGPSTALIQIAGEGTPAVHRVGDFGIVGSITGAGALTYSGPNGGSGTITATANLSTGVVAFSGSMSLKSVAQTGSDKVFSG